MPYQGGGGGYGGGGGFGGGRGGGGRGRGRGGGGGRFDDETDPSSEQFRKLFVGGLSYETDENSLRSHFEQWGDIVDCVVMRDPNSKRSRGFGFITYKDAAMIDEAQNNRPHKIDNREVETKRAMPRDSDGASNHQSVKKMFVGGLKDDTTEEQMQEVFGQFGKIDSIDIVKDKGTGKVRGFAFVTYKDYDSVDRAVLLKRHELNTRKVEVKKAVSKDQMEGSGRGGGGTSRGSGRGGSYGSSGYAANGGYGGGGYGGAGYGGGYVGQSWAGSGGGYGDYSSSWGGSGGAGAFGANYSGDYGGGPVKGGGYTARGQGPYGGGYGQGAGGYGGSSGGGFRR